MIPLKVHSLYARAVKFTRVININMRMSQIITPLWNSVLSNFNLIVLLMEIKTEVMQSSIYCHSVNIFARHIYY